MLEIGSNVIWTPSMARKTKPVSGVVTRIGERKVGPSGADITEIDVLLPTGLIKTFTANQIAKIIEETHE